ncbi:GSCFA domain-containing protein [Muricauda sp. MAR_2010_75]|uniref:GSCFA domain-containing protein n=1 Tax=Allomuricauda sp. MAR_2010_75 TaxID=1250232 RepID=UPI00055BE66E|nr:GSCFA domain-containing protein [Muricauda sp. MAR_2010_75]
MKLQTTVPLEKADDPIDYHSNLLLMGSCFVENMGGKLDYFKFQQLQNSFGILFHPLAIENLVQRSLEDSQYKEAEVFERDGIWYCFDAHSEVRANSQEALLQNLNQQLHETRLRLQNATHIIITLGTAWVYWHKTTNKIVANCHKVPQKEFSKELLPIDNIAVSLENVVKMVGNVNPDAQLIFTVSPVRHLKDGFVENQQSKAHLISALHKVLSPRARSRGLYYFPAYEIMMDELRDYRFYGKDLVHPNELAVEYIWEKFKSVWIDADCFPVMDEVDSIQKGLLHRPFNPDSEAHQKFETSLRSKITYLQERYPFMKF